MLEPNPVLWTPSPEAAARTNIAAFAAAAPGAPETYEALHRWSVEDPAGFWGSVWDRCGVIAAAPPAAVLEGSGMPGTRWFPGARLSYAENLLAGDPDRLAVVSAGEGRELVRVSLGELRRDVARVQAALVDMGVGRGDRVCAFTPNAVEALVAMLATTALGAVWTSTSPDFGVQGVVDRFAQVEPVVMVTADGYRYGGRTHALAGKVAEVVAALPTLRHVVVADFAGVGDGEGVALDLPAGGPAVHRYADLVATATGGPDDPVFTPVAPDHPLFIMYSSGTTGVPKSIVHGHGGTLVKHLVEHQLHSDVRPGDVVMWFTTCGWMMWNWLVSALASRAAVVLYDGSPSHPDPGVLWRLAEEAGVTHFGTSPKFLSACEKAGLRPREEADLSGVRAVLSTGSPLNPEQFDWVYDAVGDHVHLASVSGGTDLIGCFAAGVPTLPVRRGELQGLGLGMAVEAWDEQGRPVPLGETGELVCTRPFPSMPVGFWGDPDGSRYRAAYFDQHPGVWTHGDWIALRPEGGVVILGRSDTTLNPGGVRIGTAEIYRAVEPLPEIRDCVVVGRDVDGDVEVVLCVVLAEGLALDDALVQRIRTAIRQATTPRHVPAHVFAVPAVPYTISGKKVETAVRTVIAGGEVGNADALADPAALDHYRHLFDAPA
jgi:acetoacetyl-CoA synthetase